MKQGVEARLDALYAGIEGLRAAGFPVRAITPMGAIYLSAQFALHGWQTPSGEALATNEQIRQYLLGAAGLAVVPFQAFGMKEDTGWVRLSVGATSLAEIEVMFGRLGAALEALSAPTGVRRMEGGPPA
jgi:aspartate aminotransferase